MSPFVCVLANNNGYEYSIIEVKLPKPRSG